MKVFMKLISLLLITAMLLSLVCCRARVQDYEKEIIFTDDGLPPEALSMRAEEVFFGLLEYYSKGNSVQNLPDSTVNQLREISHGLRLALENTTLSQLDYTALLDSLSERGYSVIDEILAEGEGSFDLTRQLYLDLSARLGAGNIGGIIYDSAIYLYGYSYERNMEKYEKYGYSYLLEDAERMLREKDILTLEIGRDGFISVISSGIALGRLFLGDGFSSEEAAAFSDEELLLFVKSLDVTPNISPRGWEYILPRMAHLVGEGRIHSYLSVMAENGDLTLLSGVVNDFLTLFESSIASLTTADMSALKLGDRRVVVHSAFMKLTEAQLNELRGILELQIQADDYDSMARDMYGEDYIIYSQSLEPISFEQLRAAIGTDKFYESLERYIGTISPAFSYGMKE